MTKRLLTLCLFVAIATALAIHVVLGDNGQGSIPFLDRWLIAAGIPGVSAIAPVGTFLSGGPIPENFAAYTQPGKILDPKRMLVGSTSNFGEPLSDPNQFGPATGIALLSIGAGCCTDNRATRNKAPR